MCIHFLHNDPPGSVAIKPARYAVELVRPRNLDTRFAVRTIWMIFNRAGYNEAVRDPLAPNNSQYLALRAVIRLSQHGSTLIGPFACRDIAETKILELQNQERVFSHRLPARCVKLQ